MQVNIREAENQLSRLGELAWQGERIVIAKEGRPYLDLVPHRDAEHDTHPDGASRRGAEGNPPENPVTGVSRDGGPQPRRERRPGLLKGQIWIPPDFDEPDEEIIRLFEGDE